MGFIGRNCQVIEVALNKSKNEIRLNRYSK